MHPHAESGAFLAATEGAPPTDTRQLPPSALFDELKAHLAPVIRRMPAYGRLVWALYRDPAVSRRHKALLSAGLAYSLSPVDLVPGLIPVVGQMDDLLVGLHTLRAVLSALPAERRDVHLVSVGLDGATLDDDIRRVHAAARRLAREGMRASAKAAGFGLRTAAAALRLIARTALTSTRAVLRRHGT